VGLAAGDLARGAVEALASGDPFEPPAGVAVVRAEAKACSRLSECADPGQRDPPVRGRWPRVSRLAAAEKPSVWADPRDPANRDFPEKRHKLPLAIAAAARPAPGAPPPCLKALVWPVTVAGMGDRTYARPSCGSFGVHQNPHIAEKPSRSSIPASVRSGMPRRLGRDRIGCYPDRDSPTDQDSSTVTGLQGLPPARPLGSGQASWPRSSAPSAPLSR
jgi:hypothetical protein